MSILLCALDALGSCAFLFFVFTLPLMLVPSMTFESGFSSGPAYSLKKSSMTSGCYTIASTEEVAPISNGSPEERSRSQYRRSRQ